MAKITEHFDSMEALLATIESRPVNNAFASSKSSDKEKLSSRTGDDEFCGTKSFEEAVELMMHGWDEPLSKLKKEASKLQAKSNMKTSKYVPTSGVVGFAPIVPNAIMGLPNSMIHYNKTQQKVKAVTLVYGNHVNCGWTTDEIIKASVVALQIVNELELMGYRVKLAVEGYYGERGRNSARFVVDVKDWRQPIDLKKLAFPMVHPSMLRRIAFAWLETTPELSKDMVWGYGVPANNKNYESVVAELKRSKQLGENDFYLTPYMIKDCGHDVNKVMERAGMLDLRKAVS